LPISAQNIKMGDQDTKTANDTKVEKKKKKKKTQTTIKTTQSRDETRGSKRVSIPCPINGTQS